MKLRPEELTFPVLCFEGSGFIRVRHDWDDLRTTTTAGVGNRMFENVCLVDAGGRMTRVIRAEIEEGVGLFWGYNIFLDRRVRVALIVEDEVRKLELAEVKQKLLRSLEAWRGWASGGSLPELKVAVRDAASVRDLIDLLESPLAGTRDSRAKRGFYHS